MRAKLEAIRKKVGELMGIAVSQSIPKISFIAAARDFRTVTGETIGKESVSLLARLMAMGLRPVDHDPVRLHANVLDVDRAANLESGGRGWDGSPSSHRATS